MKQNNTKHTMVKILLVYAVHFIVKGVAAISYQRPLVDIFETGDTFFLECEPRYHTHLHNHLQYVQAQFIKEDSVIPTRDGLDSENIAFSDRVVLSEGAYVSQSVEAVVGSRYRVEVINATTHKYRFLITDLKPEDSGQIGCLFMSSREPEIQSYFCNITVIGPPLIMLIQYTADTLSYKSHLQNQSVLQVNEGEMSPISCAVIYPNYRPSIHFLLDGGEIRGEGYNMKADPPFLTYKEKEGPLTFVEFREEHYLTDFNVNRTFHNKLLTCEARGFHPIWQQVIHSVKTYVILNVAYSPEMKCNGTLVTIQEPDVVQSVVCDVYSNPPAHTTWYTTTNQQENEHSKAAVSVGYCMQEAFTEGELTKLVIQGTLSMHDANVLVLLTSSNTRGNSSVQVRFQRGDWTTVTSPWNVTEARIVVRMEAINAAYCSVPTLLLIAFVSVVLHYVQQL